MKDQHPSKATWLDAIEIRCPELRSRNHSFTSGSSTSVSLIIDFASIQDLHEGAHDLREAIETLDQLTTALQRGTELSSAHLKHGQKCLVKLKAVAEKFKQAEC